MRSCTPWFFFATLACAPVAAPPPSTPSGHQPEAQCSNGVDDDLDNLVDCEDSDCAIAPSCGPENTDYRCNDGRDNDGDGDLDCDDADCRSTAEVDYCGSEGSNARCADRIDNDGDGLIDCDDFIDCAVSAPCTGSESMAGAGACADHLDNDQDSLTDCQDTDCQGAGLGGCMNVEACGDCFDNNGDGAVDCADEDCTGSPACSGASTEKSAATCSDKLDNDRDCATDCADPDCRNAVDFCGSEDGARCADGKDNDGDRATDCEDSDCAAAPACVVVPAEDALDECTDLGDNDQDGLIDCQDPGCAAQPVCGPENGDTVCSDGFDNDGDTAIDCDDSDCDTTLTCSGAENTPALCRDGLDNDGDALIDCADSNCANVVMTPGCGPENTDTACGDNFDNNGDRAVDCDDPECRTTTPCSGEISCTNLIDDDGDSFVDCDDFDCLLDWTKTACDTPARNVHDLQDATATGFPAAKRGDAIDDPVRLRGVVVTYIETNPRHFIVSDASPATTYSAMRVFVPASVTLPALAAGDVIDVAGVFTEFAGESELTAYALRDTGTNAAPPAARAVSLADLVADLPSAEAANDRFTTSPTTGEVTDPLDDLKTAERYESMLTRLSSLVVTAVNRDSAGAVDTYQVGPDPDSAGSPRFLIGTRYFSPTPELGVGQPVAGVSGVMSYFRRKISGNFFISEYRLLPRAAADWSYVLIVDGDFDGLSDADELLFNSDPSDPDTDRDHIWDGDEVVSTDPNDPMNDTDGDGINDILESFLHDRDGDDIPDDLDAVNLDGPNDDRDGDGVANASDPDDDNDGICDPGVAAVAGVCTTNNGLGDNCPYAPETQSGNVPRQLNLDAQRGDPDPYLGEPGDRYDGRGAGDACDWDPDGDIWPGPFDNCPYLANRDQTDSDADDIGDACDTGLAFAPLPCLDPTNGGFDSCDLIFEEVLYNLSTAAASVVDANHDGVGHLEQDEFVELRNTSGGALDLSNLVLQDEAYIGTLTVRHRFPAGTVLLDNRRVVVFGGGTPSLFPSSVLVQVASGGMLGLSNAGDTIYLVDAGDPTITSDDVVLAELSFGRTGQPTADRNVSLTRYPEGSDFWMPHPQRTDAATAQVWNISPGRAPDNGTP